MAPCFSLESLVGRAETVVGMTTDAESNVACGHSGGRSEEGLFGSKVGADGVREGDKEGTVRTDVVGAVDENERGRLMVVFSFGEARILDGVVWLPFPSSLNFADRYFEASAKTSFPVVPSTQVFKILSASGVVSPDALIRRWRRLFSSADSNSS